MIHYAEAKGRNPAWGLLGLFGLIGLGVLACLKDKAPEVLDKDSERTKAVVATLRAGNLLAGAKVRVLDDALVVYQDCDLQSPVLASVHGGTEIQLGPMSEVEGRAWIEAALPTGVKGYLLQASARSHAESCDL